MSKTERIKSLASRSEGASSIDVQEACRVNAANAHSHLTRLTQTGKLFRACQPGLRIRWFTNPARADAYGKFKPAPRAVIPAPVIIAPVKLRGRAITPKTAVRSRGLSAGFDPRYQCDPASSPFGAGFAAVGVGRDVDTGRPWAR